MTAITASKNEILIEETSYRSAVSEALMQKMGASINYLLEMGAVGDVVSSALTTAQFQAQRSTNWVLCNGASCVGTEYETITGLSTVPDLRGEFIRGSDNGRGVDSGRALLSTQSAANASHSHFVGLHYTGAGTDRTLGTVAVLPDGASTGPGFYNTNADSITYEDWDTGSQGSEARPRNVALNFFIRVD